MVLTSNKLDKEALLLEETLFHVANGYLGVRGNFEEGSDDTESVCGCYINGFYDTVSLSYPERLYGFAQHAQRMINLPDIQAMKIILDGTELHPLKSQVAEYIRSLDTSEGVSKRSVRYAVDSGTIDITFRRMASFRRPELFLTMLEVRSEGLTGKLEIRTGIDCNVRNFTDPDDPRVASEAIRHLHLEGTQRFADGGIVRCSTAASGLEIVVAQRIKCENTNIDIKTNDEGITIQLTTELRSGESIAVEKYTVLSDSRRQQKPEAYALKTIEECLHAGSAVLLAEQKVYLKDFQRVAAIETKGSQEVQDTLEFNMFQLLQSCGRDGISAIAAKGISGEGYEGHYFWDTEIYIFPFFLFTKPKIAKALLDYRYSILDSAREHARILGHQKGALYAWRTISGSECSAYYPSGSAQYHINGDIAYSFMQYWYATNDLEFMADKGTEVLIETARLWLDAGHYDEKGRFLIHTVTGPDEYTCIVNNNYYTNRCAQANLRGAAKLCRVLWQAGKAENVERCTGVTREEAKLFERAAEAMWLPYDAERDINAQDDSFLEKPVWDMNRTPPEQFPLLLHYHPLYLYRHQVNKQADTVLAHFLFEDGVEESTIRNSYDYYERITTHDSSLSRCIFSIMAARLCMEEKAYDYFMDTLRTDLDDTHGNTKDGLHTANLGGSWLALVMGFAGMRLNEDGLHFRFLQPRQWERTGFRIRYLGRLIHIQMEREKTTLSIEEGEPVQVYVNGEQLCLTKAIKVVQYKR